MQSIHALQEMSKVADNTKQTDYITGFFFFLILLCTGKNIKAKYIYSFQHLNKNSYKQVLPSREISFHGLGGYMKAAFWIWSCMSSSSLNGKVPLRLT